ncbi:MAG: hybrid sensor histidine kinase/response regulator [Verrucomicrobia bacterium]|nr:hybrid sensor histidine kinase/response regulator [Verrucomicrobiota bacterium]
MNKTPDANDIADILVVDDNPDNLRLLGEMLKSWGYKARLVTGGAIALQAARSKRPDVILLDIHMPEMNGYQFCGHLKADAALKEIPVLFISALNDTEDKVKAFECGGADYITKPFHADEIQARIKAHLELHQQRKRLQESYDKLCELETLRDSLVHMVIHDMRSPITVISGVLDMLCNPSITNLDEEKRGMAEMAFTSAQKLADMISQLLAVSRLEAGEMHLEKTDCDLAQIIQSVVEPFKLLSGDRSITIQAQPGVSVLCDQKIVQRIIENLVGNALKFTPENSEVKIALSSSNQEACVSVTDNGPGIPKEFHQKVFEKFGQATVSKNKKLGTGLGLAFCRLAVEAHGGKIGVESKIRRGSTFWFILPLET